MAFKIILIVLIILIVGLVILPFILRIAGIPILDFRSSATRGTRSDLLLRSDDEGMQWASVSFKGQRAPVAILDIAFDPENPQIMWLGTRGAGLWRSGDSGLSWDSVNDGGEVFDARADIYKIGVNNSDPKILYLAIFEKNRGRVFKSEDGGVRFREIYFVNQDRFGIFDLWVHPHDPKLVLVASGQGALLESSSGGKNWRVVHWFREPIIQLVVNHFFPKEMYVLMASGKLLKTFDGGKQWTDLNKGLQRITSSGQTPSPPRGLFGGSRSRQEGGILIPDPQNFITVYLGSWAGLLRSSNSGFTWEKIPLLVDTSSVPIKGIAVHPADSRTIFVTVGNQLHKSTDGGVNWSVTTLPAQRRVAKVFIHPKEPKIMFAALER